MSELASEKSEKSSRPPRLSPPTARTFKISQAAEESGIPGTTIRDAIGRGELQVIRVGKNEHYARHFIERAEFWRWYESRKVTVGR